MSTAVAQADPGARNLTGTLPDGATWIADVPTGWNGTLVLYSDGYGPLTAQDAPNAATGRTCSTRATRSSARRTRARRGGP